MPIASTSYENSNGRHYDEFFCDSDVPLTWQSVNQVGPGLTNLGNTCFLNSVLQCLTHTVPLAELFLQDVKYGSGSGPVHITQEHIKKAYKGSSTIAPMAHANSLSRINKSFRIGQQEDAHEYLRCLIDAMHESFLRNIYPRPLPHTAATTLVHRIFGGWLCSQIRCDDVTHESNKYDPFMDLSLGINKVNSVTKALQLFTSAEILDGNNKYRCPKSNAMVKATKQITIEEAPNVLTIHLKRSEFGLFGSKLSKKIEFGLSLDLQPFMHSKSCGPQMYDLYGLIVHHGSSLQSGHYTCYVKAADGCWHSCDDSRVRPATEHQVLEQEAYILFYIRRRRRNVFYVPPPVTVNGATAEAAATSISTGEKKKASREQRRKKTKEAAADENEVGSREEVDAAARSKKAGKSGEKPGQAQQRQGSAPATRAVEGTAEAQKSEPSAEEQNGDGKLGTENFLDQIVQGFNIFVEGITTLPNVMIEAFAPTKAS